MGPTTAIVKEGLGTGLLVFFLVLVVDVPVVLGAMIPLMGDSSIVGYKYMRETRIAASMLLVYALLVLGLGYYWYRTQQRTARLVGMLVGLLPVLIIAWQYIIQLILA